MSDLIEVLMQKLVHEMCFNYYLIKIDVNVLDMLVPHHVVSGFMSVNLCSFFTF